MSAPSPKIYAWFAVWSGLCVAAIYFCQPLLHLFAHEFGVSDHEASLVATSTQIGYGVGMLFLLPLGDFYDRKRLVLLKLALLTAALLLNAFAPNLHVMIAASFLIGLFATVAQDVLPVAADLAPDAKRAQYVGFVMTGLMSGILLSRTASGVIASWQGWRAVFVVGAAATVFCFVTSMRAFPVLPVRERGSIASIYASMWTILRRHPALGLTLLRHGVLSMAFSGFWTCLSFFLSGEPYGWDSSRIGMMGLAGAAGALSTSFVGTISDRRGPHFMIRTGALLALLSFAAMGAFSSSVLVLIAGVLLFDLGVQSSLISHQAIVYSLDPQARGRINGIFVCSIFVFFALGSFFSGVVWSSYGWTGLMTASAACACLTLVLSFVKTREKELA